MFIHVYYVIQMYIFNEISSFVPPLDIVAGVFCSPEKGGPRFCGHVQIEKSVFLCVFDAPHVLLRAPLLTSSSMFTVCDACAQNQASWNTPPEPPEPAKWCQELRLGAHLPHAPGARMTVVTQTPSNEESIVLESLFHIHVTASSHLDGLVNIQLRISN